MKLTNFIIAAVVVIAATLNFGAQGFPRPQINIRDRSRNFVTVGGIVFDGPTSASRTSPIDPPIGSSNILEGIVFDGPISESKTSPIGLSNVLEGIVFDGPTNGSPASSNDAPNFPKHSSIVTPNRPTQSPVVVPTPVPTSVRPDVALCNRNCKGTPEYNPVCGSDGVTYSNPGRLICATNCGINVTQLRTGPCTIIKAS